MARTKISEFSATPANNTDIDSINIAEGCAPSGINDAIRELMAQLKDFQTGAVGDSFNGPIGTSTAAAGAFTTLSATGAITSTLATGTAPLVIASTTKVANLNVDLLDGADWASPAALGSTTPAAGSFTTLGASSTATLNTLVSSGATLTGGTINGMTIGATTASTGAFTTLSASSTVTLSGGTANGVAYLNGSKVVTSGSALTFDGSNLGLGVTPSAWSGLTALQLTGNGSLAGVSNAIHLSFNAYYNGSNWIYNTTANASNYYQSSGQHIWRTAASGTAGNAITFTQAMTLDASGNLGIGTSSPAYKLDVDATSSANAIQANSTNATYGVSVNLKYNGTAIGQIGSSKGIDSTGNLTDLAFNSAANLDFATGYTRRMRLDSSGNLGLGVTPSSWNSVYRAFQLPFGASLTGRTDTPETLLASNTYRDSGGFKYFGTGLSTAYFQTGGVHSWHNAPTGTAGNAITFTQAMTLDASGNLLVGTTSAFSPLTVNGSNRFDTVTFGDIGTPANNAGIYLRGTGANGISWASGGYLAFFGGGVGSTERARIDSSGNLLVGTTSQIASTRSVIAGSSANAQVIYFNNTRNNGSGDATAISLLGSSDNNTSNYHFIGTTGGTDRVYIFGNGNIQNTNNSYGAISDVKLKENIVDTTPKLADLMQVKVRNYNLIGDTAKQLGVVAQELETVFPAMVEESPDRDAEGNDLGTTTKSVKYSVFVPMLIKALQEQQEIINSLKARLDADNL